MSEPRVLIDASCVPAGGIAPVCVDDRWYVVCNDGGRFHVTDFHCPHAQGPLAKGDLRDGKLICPVHHWPWDLETGLTDPDMPHCRLRVYPTEVRDGKVVADLSESTQSTPPPS